MIGLEGSRKTWDRQYGYRFCKEIEREEIIRDKQRSDLADQELAERTFRTERQTSQDEEQRHVEEIDCINGRVQCRKPDALAVTIADMSETYQNDAERLGDVDPFNAWGGVHIAS